MTHRISTHGLNFVKGFEGFVPFVYDDMRPISAGKYKPWKPADGIRGTLTIGYGHTDDAKYKIGFKLKDAPSDYRITESQAAAILDIDMDGAEADVNRDVKVPITQGMFDALASLVFNLGPLRSKAQTLLNRLNAKDYDGARAAFDLYVRSGGVTLPGLQRRRDGEQLLWDEGDIAPAIPAPGEIVEHTADVDAANPETVAQTVTSKEGGTLTLTGAVAAGQAANDALTTYTELKKNAQDSGLMDLIGTLLTNPKFIVPLLIAAGVGYAFWRLRKQRLHEAG